MSEYYLDTEVGCTDPEIVEKLRKGENVSFNPEKYKIITIQYQRIGKYGGPVGDLIILKEWESSEENIIKKFSKILCPENKWKFIPVGFNIYFDLGIFKHRARIYGIHYDNWFIYHNLPVIDIKPICLAMNGFNFKGCGLDKFTGKEHSGAIVPVWYNDGEYNKILDYIQKETQEFLFFYRKLRYHLSGLKDKFLKQDVNETTNNLAN
ncbi:MAG: hypothetical protein J7J15_00530 [Candidatus Aenigmarchaeota archaeon]|nr:hypothetical protein [Candidatus Aenigmarchaeota archaeon]